jgi:hypothetical protein
MSGLDVNRREFMKVAAGAGAALALPTFGNATGSSKMIGIQVGAISFVHLRPRYCGKADSGAAAA